MCATLNSLEKEPYIGIKSWQSSFYQLGGGHTILVSTHTNCADAEVIGGDVMRSLPLLPG